MVPSLSQRRFFYGLRIMIIRYLLVWVGALNGFGSKTDKR